MPATVGAAIAATAQEMSREDHQAAFHVIIRAFDELGLRAVCICFLFHAADNLADAAL